jgi:hypothetical protein
MCARSMLKWLCTHSLCVSLGFAGIDRMERTERTYRYPEVLMDVSLKSHKHASMPSKMMKYRWLVSLAERESIVRGLYQVPSDENLLLLLKTLKGETTFS